MSLIRSLSQGSLWSDEGLLQAIDGYSPISAASSAELAFDRWTRRMATQPELGVARELAGLPEETLAGLASVFEHSPRRQRVDKLRFAIPLGILSVLMGAAVLSLAAGLPGSDGATVSPAQSLGIAFVGIGVIAIFIGVIIAFSLMPLDAAHAKLGLCTGVLDEQHPWLYQVSLVMRDSAADAYRKRILVERGVLRGMDYLMMREIARANDALAMTRVARSVAEQVRRVDARPGIEPRLVAAPIDRRRPA